MFFKPSALVLLLLSQAASIAAAPVSADHKAQEDHQGSSKFSIQAHANSHRVRNGPRAMRRMLAKHKIPIPQALAKLDMAALTEELKAIDQKHNHKRQTAASSVAAHSSNYFDTEYVCPVNVGGQTLLLNLDTGSSDLWVFSEKLSATQRGSHPIYNSTASKTWKSLPNYSWSIRYGDGSGASGLVGTETVSVGNVTVTSQAVEIATAVSTQFTQDTANNGLIGLGFSSLNTIRPVQQKTWFENVKSQLAKPLFTANLKHNAIGSYDFGFINSTNFNGSIAYANVTTPSYWWQFKAPVFKVGNTTYSTPSTTAIADTGTTLILVSNAIASAYYAKVPISSYNRRLGGWTFPCNAPLPSLTLSVGNNLAVIPGSDLNFGYADSRSCYGAIQGADTNMLIYGDIFFKRWFTVFDYGTVGYPRVGIAPKSTY